MLLALGSSLLWVGAAQAQPAAGSSPGAAESRQDGARHGRASKVEGAKLGRIVPRPRTALPPALQLKLVQALPVAARKVHRVASCESLFSRLGADGTERLSRTLYHLAPPAVVEGRCRQGALAATNPGSAVTWLCPAFASLSNFQAAMTLIHEALHFAGLPERPQVSGALSSAEINDMVRDACGS